MAFPPPPPELDRVLRLLRPLERLHSPVFTGWPNVPDRGPLLFVGNHTVLGVVDVPFLFAALWKERRIFLRALGDHEHFRVPGWRDFLTRFGVVDGTRENCAALFEAGESVLVFPGGAREVFKRKGEKYQLIWKERTGFARMAIRHGVPIVPFAALGVEDAVDILVDADDLLSTAPGRAIRRLGIREDLLPPIVRGVGPTPLPRPERFYFRFEPPILTAGLSEDEAAIWSVREQTRAAIEHGLDALQALRASDPGRTLPGRVRQAVGRRARFVRSE